MRDSHFDWDADYTDIYSQKKETDETSAKAVNHEELTNITYQIRKDLQCRRINVFINDESKIVLSSTLKNKETMHTVMEILDEMNRLYITYLSDFDISYFDLVMEGDNPVIYCTYERI